MKTRERFEEEERKGRGTVSNRTTMAWNWIRPHMAYRRYKKQNIRRHDFACACDQIVLKYISCSGTFHECRNLKITTV